MSRVSVKPLPDTVLDLARAAVEVEGELLGGVVLDTTDTLSPPW